MRWRGLWDLICGGRGAVCGWRWARVSAVWEAGLVAPSWSWARKSKYVLRCSSGKFLARSVRRVMFIGSMVAVFSASTNAVEGSLGFDLWRSRSWVWLALAG